MDKPTVSIKMSAKKAGIADMLDNTKIAMHKGGDV